MKIIKALLLLSFTVTGCSLFNHDTSALAVTEETAYYTCGGCHGANNIRVTDMSPKIIGQKQTYLANKLREFRDLKRINPYMNGVLKNMSDQELDNLAAYYAQYNKNKHF